MGRESGKLLRDGPRLCHVGGVSSGFLFERASDVGMSFIGDEYLAQVDATRDLLELASVTSPASEDEDAATQWLNSEQLEEFREVMGQFARLGSSFLEEWRGGPNATLDLNEIVIEDGDVASAFMEVILGRVHRIKMPPRHSLLMRSMLSLAISDFELLMSRIVGHLLSRRPTLLGEDSTLSLADLEALGDVAAARRLIIDRKVDDLMRQSLDKWATWFDRSGVKFKEMCDDWTEFGEIFARRNLVVHTGGRVSEQYRGALAKLGVKPTNLPDVGEELDLTPEYLERSSEDLLSFGFLLLAGTWLQLEKEDSLNAENWVVSRASQLVNRGHYRAARTICRTVLERSRGRLRRSIELSLTLLLWTARRELEEEAAVRKEVEAWDIGGIDLVYSHAKSVFLENDEDAITEILELRRRNQLSSIELRVNPLYKRLLERRHEDILGDTLAIAESPAGTNETRMPTDTGTDGATSPATDLRQASDD